ncbi:DUF3376 domain-containing protein, partial [Mycetocola zhadangensis]|uniref:DUF3376 domain-containing protein n=1 Tax=Mycetocola zhadangensis TaxID=1164595 RepID=UPI003A4DE553
GRREGGGEREGEEGKEEGERGKREKEERKEEKGERKEEGKGRRERKKRKEKRKARERGRSDSDSEVLVRLFGTGLGSSDKLAGTDGFNFGGFLSRVWRTNDCWWG